MCSKIVKILFYAFVFISITSCLTFAQDDNNHPDGNWLCGTPVFTDSLKKLALENTKLLDPLTYQLMLKKTNEIKLKKIQSDSIGTIASFFTYNFVTKSYNTVNAKLLRKGTKVQVWIDTTELSNNHASQGVADTLFNSLENKTPSASRDSSKGIVKLNELYFGDPPNKDGDNLTDFLVFDIKDGWNGNTITTFTKGYFNPGDQKNITNSNKRDLLYIDSKPGIFRGGSRNATNPLATLAHEFQHLIHYNYDKKEIPFVNEGLALLASVISGYQLRSPSRYFNSTDVPLLGWDNESSSVLDDYSRAALFTLYYAEQFGDSVLMKVVKDTLIGEKSFNNVFGTYKSSLNEIFKNFSIANYINKKSINNKYGYTYSITGKPNINYLISKPNTLIGNIQINNFTAQYLKIISLIDTVQIKLIGSDVKGNIIAAYKNNLYLVDSLVNEENYKLPDFNANIDSVICVVVNENTTKKNYDINISSKDNNIYWTRTKWNTSAHWRILYDGNNRFYMQIDNAIKYTDSTYNEIKHISISSSITSNLFIKNDTLYVGTNYGEIFYSPDSGTTWNQIPTSAIAGNSAIAGISVDNNFNIYIANHRQNSLFWLSKDKGNHWINLDNPNIFNTISKRGYFILTDSLNYVYAFTELNEIFFSENMGDDWILLDDSWDRLNSFAKIDSYGNFISRTSGRGLFKRNPIGVISSLGVPKSWMVQDIAFHPSKDSVMMIAVRYNPNYPDKGGGIYSTNNNGKSWQKINGGLEDLNGISVGIDKNGNAIASTSTAIHRLKSFVTEVEEKITSTPQKFVLHQNYPNPFNPSTVIKYSIPVETRHGVSPHVSLKIYNILGQEVTTLVNKKQTPGRYEVEFDASHLASGIYIYRLVSGEFVSSKKLLLLK
ncbi:MAG: T9SS type A sorting domain-containing protein [Melioribacteraceae bacterium]|nr:T9SS type A sorting domain-containing protein [Melioribacteraceae bacterium]